ncbi:MAG TPA: DUF3108 domain-containing protein [Candidatus Acidoferrum sp.]|jgi:hypothetical protein|nr:DUF3108 domain-containing protein [Candidatus Acidoferrum sp.]
MSHRSLRLFLFVFVLGLAAFGLYRVEKRQNSSRLALAAGTPSGSSQPAASSGGTPAVPEAPAANSPEMAHSRTTEAHGALPAEAALALRPGEILDFKASVSQLNHVASLRLEVVERRNFLGKSVWHIQAFAHTENPLRFVFALDDQFDSYSDAATLHSVQYELHLNERGQKLDSVQRLTSSGNMPAASGAVQTRVLPGTRDPLGMMQFLRTVDWSRTPEVRCPVYDGHKLYDVRANVAGSASITVPAGTFDTSKIAIRVFDNGAEMKDASFALYIARDPGKTPVLLEAVLPFASARVELDKIH